MDIRFSALLLFLVSSESIFAFPTELSGTWSQPNKKESGVMKIVVTEPGVATLRGRMEIQGSAYCSEPIKFRGTIFADKVLIENDEAIVCGYQGKLTGEVVKEAEFIFTGKFAYKFWGITWAEGTFHVVPVEKDK